MGVFRPKNRAPPSTCERRGQPTVCPEKRWNSLTDVLVVLSALIINRWETGPIYQSEEKLIDTGFDFIAVTCCLGASQLFFLFVFQGKVFDSTSMLGKAPKKKKLFRALSPTHMNKETYACRLAHRRTLAYSQLFPCHFPTVTATRP